MPRSNKRSKTNPAYEASLRTWILIISGFVAFYLGSQALTAEDAHLWHWGLAIVGGVAGWLVGVAIQRLRRRSA